MFKVNIIWNFNSILAWGCAVLLGIVLGMKPSYDLLVQSQKKNKNKKDWKNAWYEVFCYAGNYESYSIYRKRLLSLIKPIANSIFNETNPKGKQLLTRLWVV